LRETAQCPSSATVDVPFATSTGGRLKLTYPAPTGSSTTADVYQLHPEISN
jgi:hypothetical protein